MTDTELSRTKMTLVRETKGAVLYENVLKAPGEAVTNLYLRKSGLASSVYPQVIYVAIDAEEE